MPPPVYILGGARTPMAEYVGALKDVPATELGAVAARAALDRTGVRADWVDHVVIGHVLQSGGESVYAARHLALRSGVPIDTPAFTVNRLCGSGIQAAVTGAQMIQLGEANVVLSGGIESMSQAPHVLKGFRSGNRFGHAQVEDSLYESLLDRGCGLMMAQTAEKCAEKYDVTREEQDRYALRSQQAAARAWAEGRLAEEVVPVEVKSRKGPAKFDRDDHLRPDTTFEALAKLPCAFSKDGSVTAGNASGIVDGGAAVILASESAIAAHGLRALARLVAWAVVGVDPAYMGLGPVPAIRQVLARAGLSLGDIDLIEVNEAFAAQYLAVERALSLDREKVNVNGGAIALGHPLGMTGTRLLLTLTPELCRRGQRYGLAAACIGGGQGIAAIVERT
jgi:acetyl-CoA acetyltransferase family protein